MSQPSWIGYSLNGRYRIEELIGKGGMSTVYKATDPNLRRAVAVKLIHSHLTDDPEFVRRFEEEAAAVARLSHPNIIQVYDFNKDGDVYYMVLELLSGETLQTLLQKMAASRRTLPIKDAVSLLATISEAVDYAHSQGMIHRDIKPANVMLTEQGRPVLMDFGVVRMLDSQHQTATGSVIGTALYMSPEQALGERPDERADVYSLGITLYEMISGRPPFEGDSSVATMRMHVSHPLPDITAIAPHTPPALKAIVEQALAKHKDARYQSARALADDLRGLLAGAMPGGQSATIVEPPTRSSPLATADPTRERAATPVVRPAPVKPAAPEGGGSQDRLLLWGGVGIIAVLLVVLGIVVAPRLLGGGASSTPPAEAGQPTTPATNLPASQQAGAAPTAETQAIETTPEISTSPDVPTPTLTPTREVLSLIDQLGRNLTVTEDKSARTLTIAGDGLPDHETGTGANFPNAVQAVAFSFTLPLDPQMAAQPTDLPVGRIGIALSGALLYSPFTPDNPDATSLPAMGWDTCFGHPDHAGQYNYMQFSPCVLQDVPGVLSDIFGIAFDGFTIYGPQDVNGQPPTDLDQCHGHTGPTPQYPEGTYHYHTRSVFPHILGCFSGVVNTSLFSQAQPPPGGGGPPPTPPGGGPP